MSGGKGPMYLEVPAAIGYVRLVTACPSTVFERRTVSVRVVEAPFELRTSRNTDPSFGIVWLFVASPVVSVGTAIPARLRVLTGTAARGMARLSGCGVASDRAVEPGRERRDVD